MVALGIYTNQTELLSPDRETTAMNLCRGKYNSVSCSGVKTSSSFPCEGNSEEKRRAIEGLLEDLGLKSEDMCERITGSCSKGSSCTPNGIKIKPGFEDGRNLEIINNGDGTCHYKLTCPSGGNKLVIRGALCECMEKIVPVPVPIR